MFLRPVLSGTTRAAENPHLLKILAPFLSALTGRFRNPLPRLTDDDRREKENPLPAIATSYSPNNPLPLPTAPYPTLSAGGL